MKKVKIKIRTNIKAGGDPVPLYGVKPLYAVKPLYGIVFPLYGVASTN